MSAYNPYVVAQALADLSEEMARWTSTAQETLAMASYAQLQAKERVDRGVHHAAIVFDQAEQDEERVQKAISDCAALMADCLTAREQAGDTLEEAQGARQDASATLQEWEEELEQALAWLRRAEARLARAIEEYEQARRAYAAAQAAYDRAVARYNACASNRERTNCDSEARAVRDAEVDMHRAAAWVRAAEAEVIAAREEVEMAKARVACCRRAVAFATEAVGLAQEAVAEATQAANSAERGLEFAQAAEKLTEAARQNVADEKDAAERMKTTTHEATVLADEAASQLTTADKAEESSQRYSSSARQELQHRMGLLHLLNRPSLNDISQSSPSRSGSHGYAYQKARKLFMAESLKAPLVGKQIKGWVKQEFNRAGKGGYLRSPPGYDVGHKIAGIDLPENFQWEYASMNRSKGAKYKR